MSMSSSKMIVLKSSDEQIFEIEESVAMMALTIRHMIEENWADSTIPLYNVTGKTLAKVIEYCKCHHVADESKLSNEDGVEVELKNFDAEFVKVDMDTLFDLIMAANFLNIQGLLDLTCQTVANMIKGKSVEEIRKILNVQSDFTPEEEENLRRENAWAFE